MKDINSYSCSERNRTTQDSVEWKNICFDGKQLIRHHIDLVKPRGPFANSSEEVKRKRQQIPKKLLSQSETLLESGDKEASIFSQIKTKSPSLAKKENGYYYLCY